MPVGQRLQAFLDAHNQSYRDAAAISGVGHETIRRHCRGYWGPTSEYQIKRIVAGYRAVGYRIDEASLLEGQDPRGDFEWGIRHACASQRIAFLAMTMTQRVRLTITFLSTRYPDICQADQLAVAGGLDEQRVAFLLRAWESRVPDATTALSLAEGIHRLTRIPMTWFRYGWLDTESPASALIDGVSRACALGRATPKATKAVVDLARSIGEQGLERSDVVKGQRTYKGTLGRLGNA